MSSLEGAKLRAPQNTESRVSELGSDSKEQKVVRKLYRLFPEWLAQRQPVANTFALAAAVFAGFRHPYWYARDAAITFLAENETSELKEVFVPLGQLRDSPLSTHLKPGRAMIFGNESAGGFIPPERIAKAQSTLDALEARPGRRGLTFLETIRDDDAIASMRAVLKYCQEHTLGLIEASDIVVPIADQCLTRHENLRAPFIDRMEP